MTTMRTLSDELFDHIVARAAQSNVSDKLNLNFDFGEHEPKYGLKLIVVNVTGDGEQSIYCDTMHEVNIADWIAEKLRDNEDWPFWEVKVFGYDDDEDVECVLYFIDENSRE